MSATISMLLPAHQLVRHQHSPHSMRIRHLHLVRCRQRDSPRATSQLHVEELGSHRRLSVRSQPHPIGIDEALHPMQVVLNLVSIQHCRGQAQIFAQKVPSAPGKLFRRRVLLKFPNSLVQYSDHFFSPDLLQVFSHLRLANP